MSESLIPRILEAARWAPSGDNTQPWRFRVLDERTFVVCGFDTRQHCVYDVDGWPSQIAIGCLLENITIAAAHHGQQAVIVRNEAAPAERPEFEVHLREAADAARDPLYDVIPSRAVQRRAMSSRGLTEDEYARLEAAVGPGFGVRWVTGWRGRWQAARLMFRNAHLRLTMPEAYRVHRDVIDWDDAFSQDRVPARALGVDPGTLRLMRFVMKSWERVEFFNKYLAGTLLPRIELDLLPGLRCAAHFAILAPVPPAGIDDYVAIGRRVQRFWLTAAAMDLQLQPEMTPLIFRAYARQSRKPSSVESINSRMSGVARDVEALLGADAARRAVFMGRIGAGPAPRSRSTRLPLDRLLIK